jgi:hypothetical protein
MEEPSRATRWTGAAVALASSLGWLTEIISSAGTMSYRVLIPTTTASGQEPTALTRVRRSVVDTTRIGVGHRLWEPNDPGT